LRVNEGRIKGLYPNSQVKALFLLLGEKKKFVGAALAAIRTDHMGFRD
jgi:hypothetical protein